MIASYATDFGPKDSFVLYECQVEELKCLILATPVHYSIVKHILQVLVGFMRLSFYVIHF